MAEIVKSEWRDLATFQCCSMGCIHLNDRRVLNAAWEQVITLHLFETLIQDCQRLFAERYFAPGCLCLAEGECGLRATLPFRIYDHAADDFSVAALFRR